MRLRNLILGDNVAPSMTVMHCSCVKFVDSKPKTCNLTVAATNSADDSSDKLFDDRFRDGDESGEDAAAKIILVSCPVFRFVSMKEMDFEFKTVWYNNSSST